MANKDPQSKLFNQFIRLLIKFGVQATATATATATAIAIAIAKAKQASLILLLRILFGMPRAILLTLNQL